MHVYEFVAKKNHLCVDFVLFDQSKLNTELKYSKINITLDTNKKRFLKHKYRTFFYYISSLKIAKVTEFFSNYKIEQLDQVTLRQLLCSFFQLSCLMCQSQAWRKVLTVVLAVNYKSLLNQIQNLLWGKWYLANPSQIGCVTTSCTYQGSYSTYFLVLQFSFSVVLGNFLFMCLGSYIRIVEQLLQRWFFNLI